MKKALAVLLVFFVLNGYASFSYVRAEEKNPDLTNGYLNGRLVVDLYEEHLPQVGYYIAGVLDAYYITRDTNTVISRLYPNAAKRDIVDHIIKYYVDNPTKRYRPIIEVLLQLEEGALSHE